MRRSGGRADWRAVMEMEVIMCERRVWEGAVSGTEGMSGKDRRE